MLFIRCALGLVFLVVIVVAISSAWAPNDTRFLGEIGHRRAESVVPPTSAASGAAIESSSSDDFSMAFQESFGFFDDIPQYQWILKKKIAMGRIHVPAAPERSRRPRAYYQSNWNPDFACGEAEMIGRVGFDGHVLCDPWRLNKNGCVIYVIGLNSTSDFTFERSLKQRLPLCDIHTFDSIDQSNSADAGAPEDILTLHHIGLEPGRQGVSLAGADGNSSTIKHLPDIAQELGHTKIDYLYVDCDGCEFELVNDLHSLDVRQMTIVHHWISAPMKSTRKHNHLHDLGYVIFNKEAFIYEEVKVVALSYLKLHTSFQELPTLK